MGDMGIKERRTTILKKEKKNEEKEENKTDDDNLDTSSSRLNTVYNTFPLASVALAELNAALAEVENQDIILLLNSALLIGGPKSGNRIKGRLECSSIDVSLLSDSIAHAMHHGCRTEAAQLLLSTAIVVREVREACTHSDWLELRQLLSPLMNNLTIQNNNNITTGSTTIKEKDSKISIASIASIALNKTTMKSEKRKKHRRQQTIWLDSNLFTQNPNDGKDTKEEEEKKNNQKNEKKKKKKKKKKS